MIGTTGLKGLRVECVVGIYAHERQLAQPVDIDVELDYDFAKAVDGDAIADAVDYDHVADLLAKLAQEGRYQLLETLADTAAAAIFERFPVVRAVRLELSKPQAVPAARASFVRVERSR